MKKLTTKVFFNLRKSSRDRMWDTAREARAVCEPLTPPIAQHTSLARNQSYKTLKHKVRSVLQRWVRKLPMINQQEVSGSTDAELLYMWGAFPKKSNKPFVVELDNPYVLTYYHQGYFSLRLNTLKRRLRKARFMTFLSATARNHVLELLGQEFANKSKVIPPYMARNYRANKRPDDGKIRFLFIGFGFRRKGGPELLNAFSSLSAINAELTVVSDVPEEVKQEYKNDTRIKFFPPQPRAKLFTDFYSTHDIFVFPSLLETFGVVILEALSFGMGIITTDVYATPELVNDKKNGILLPHPFLTHINLNAVPTIDCVTTPRGDFTEQYLSVPLYESHVQSLKTAFDSAVTNKTEWQNASVQLFEKDYAPERWRDRLGQLFILDDSNIREA